MTEKTKPTHLILPVPRQARQPDPEQAQRAEGRMVIRQLWQLPVIDLATLDPAKRRAEEARRKALLEQAAQVATKTKEQA